MGNGKSNESWEENAKFVLNKLEDLEDNQEKTKQQAKKYHDEISDKIDDLRDYFGDTLRKERSDLTDALDQQDVTNQVTELQTRQKIIGAALFFLTAAMMYLHFGFALL